MKVVKPIILLLFFVTISNCKSPTKETDITSKNDLIYPKIENWTECYSNPKVKNRFESSNVYAVYLNEKSMKQIEKEPDCDLNDYAVFIKSNFKNLNKENSEFKKSLESTIKKWAKKTENKNIAIKNGIEKGIIEYKRIVFLENDNISEKIYTSIFLMKPIENIDKITIMIFNVFFINNQNIVCSYYLDLDNFNSLSKAKKNNQKILNEFIKYNVTNKG